MPMLMRFFFFPTDSDAEALGKTPSTIMQSPAESKEKKEAAAVSAIRFMKKEIAQAQLEGELYRFYSVYATDDGQPNVPEIAKFYLKKRAMLNEALRNKYQVACVCVCVYVCEREGERGREGGREGERDNERASEREHRSVVQKMPGRL